MTAPLTDAQIQSLREAAQKATPGPWAVDGYSTDAVIYMPQGEDHVSKWKHLAKCGAADGHWRVNAAYIALANPATILALLDENVALKAGIKRLSDEEELINETGCDGMLSAVHIAARLAEVENLAMVLEAEANQMREVSVSSRHRAEAAEADAARLRKALEYWNEAFATGRNEPLHIAHENGRAALTTKGTAE